MSHFTENTSKKIDVLFVFMLVTLFAATSFVLVLIGAKQYRYVTDTMNTNYQDRTVSSYLLEKVRQYDTKDAISVTDLDGTLALSIFTSEDGYSYTTHIYYYNGYLRELVVTDDSVYSLASGQEIIAIQGFTPTFVNDSLMNITVISPAGDTQSLYFNIHSDTAKEAL